MNLTVRIDGKPVPFQRPRKGRNGGFYNTPRYQAWKDSTRLVLRNAMKLAGQQPTDEPVRVEIVVGLDSVCVTFQTVDHWSNRPRGDLDNYVKAVLDAANETVFVDDRQVYQLEAWFQ